MVLLIHETNSVGTGRKSADLSNFGNEWSPKELKKNELHTSMVIITQI